jgi:NAD+ synthase (glutamine-hydrolysing)
MSLTICTAQHNFVVGDIEGNARLIIEAAHQAAQQGAQLLLTPELALSGYAAEDLYLRPSFVQACDDALQRIVQQTAALKDLTLLVGHPTFAQADHDNVLQPSRSVAEAPCFNAASVVRAGQVLHTYVKRELPNYQVFDEKRYFKPGHRPCVFEVPNAQGQPVKVGVLICEDAWHAGPAQDCKALGAQMLVVINASPYHRGKGAEREAAMLKRAQDCQLPLVYAHLVGGQDEIVFEGRSFAVHQLEGQWQIAARASSFQEQLFTLQALSSASGLTLQGPIAQAPDDLAELWHALVLGVRDYIGKNHFPGVVLGLSGGIDSALVLAIAVDAVGPERVRTVMMPSPYTADISWLDAQDMAQRMGVRHDEVNIAPHFEAFLQSLKPLLENRPPDTTEENLQARIRGTLLMALSNKFGGLVLTTGNKSEMATGYCTLYGDMAGGFAVIKDVVKTDVFKLAHWRNVNDPYGRGLNVIPERIITRPPSAELRPDQKDQDSLPPYEVLDAIIQGYMEHNLDPQTLVDTGLPQAAVNQVVRLIRINEYKRRQAPVGIRVTHRSFGKDWRYPNTNRFQG